LRKLILPNFIKGNKNLSMVFACLQVVISVLLLAALALDQWSYASFPGGWVSGWTTMTQWVPVTVIRYCC
jgi:hypothetical protein